MKQDFVLQQDLDCEFDICERIQRLVEINPWAWQSIGAVSGLLGGVLSPVVGTLFIAVTWFIHSERVVSSLDGLSVFSFILTIPLLAFGAHCLDLLERRTAELSADGEQVPDETTDTSLAWTAQGRERSPAQVLTTF